MKIAVLKGGANITFSSNNKSAANADIRYLLRTLTSKTAQFDVDIITHQTRNTQIPKSLNFREVQDVEDYNDYDLVLLFNFSINFFGGAIDLSLIQMYQALHKTKVPIVYVNTDGALPFKQLWSSIKKREWAKDFDEEMFYVNPDNVYYLTQGSNFARLEKLIESKPDYVKVSIDNFIFYPLYATILVNHEQHVKPNTIPFKERTYDLGFGGYSRNTHKRKRIEHYYNDPNYDTLLFGNLRGVNASNTTIRPKVSYTQFIESMKNCRATIIVGDKYYNNNFLTLRMFESLLADNIVYIDKQMDTRFKFYPIPYELFYIEKTSDIGDMEDDYLAYQKAKEFLLQIYRTDIMCTSLRSVITEI